MIGQGSGSIVRRRRFIRSCQRDGHPTARRAGRAPAGRILYFTHSAGYRLTSYRYSKAILTQLKQFGVLNEVHLH